jgi:hypothetical protein
MSWVSKLLQGDPVKDVLGRFVEVDHDEFETELYEEAADPSYVAVETQKRRYRGMFRRRLRHRESRTHLEPLN